MDRIAAIDLAALRALWTDPPDDFPTDDAPIWWEVWLRSDGEGQELQMRFLHPYSILRVLAACPMNANAPVDWQFGPVVCSGWADERQFLAGARRTQTFLIATEGSSDTHILERAFSLLRPGLKDFFRFIDMSEGHPFPGTGNLVRFARGLAKIDRSLDSRMR